MKIVPIGSWGRYKTWVAKVGTLPSSLILIRRSRDFCAGQRIWFCDEWDLQGTSKGCTPRWESGHIDKIQGNLLFVSRA